jgi:hypothetical protein
VEKLSHKQPEKRDVMIDINPKGKHNNEKTVEKPLYEKPEKGDVVADTNSEGKYNEEEFAEKQQVATGDGPRLRRKESIAENWKMRAEIIFVQDDGMDDAEEVIETNKEDVVRQDFAHISSKAKNKELTSKVY